MALSTNILDYPSRTSCLYDTESALYQYEQSSTRRNSAVSEIDTLRAKNKPAYR